MKILVVGGGGREHALVWKLAQSPQVTDLFCAPGNPGMEKLAHLVALSSDDIDGLLAFALEHKIDLTIVGPEAPLVAGLADRFEEAGLRVAGPSALAARLEGSKSFSKDLMAKCGVPTAGYHVFTDPAKAKDYVRAAGRPLVVKADGLCGGKGVLLCEKPEEAEAACVQIMEALAFGEAGCRIVVEEWLRGEEASFLVFTDGETVIPMPSSQDHKAVGEGDTGPNTGGMGAYSPAPVVTPEVEKKVMERVIRPVLAGMAAEGCPFKGVLYAGLMIDAAGEPWVLEFNVRFGDPECQPLLMRLDSDLAEIMLLLADGRLSEAEVNWSTYPTVCVVLAAGGYPGPYTKGKPISGLEQAAELPEVVVFHAGTAKKDGRIVTNGGRVLGVTARGSTVSRAVERAYRAVELISWEGMFYRRDIAHRAISRELGHAEVGVVMGSANDWEVMKPAVEVLKSFGVEVEARVISAHRTPEVATEYATHAKERGMKVIIAGAGWAAHLAGAMAAHTTLPIIGVPIASSTLAGYDSLLATVQMPPGIPVATVAVGSGGAHNAGVLAAQILALSDPELAQRLLDARRDMAAKIATADARIRRESRG
ncbi:MAG: phosphoribosylamine--glycine ligase [Deltaproteobacteria bacterium]|nr:phosphoribosylamine--glycine ligase [Deltaproteobacteria bacterium]